MPELRTLSPSVSRRASALVAALVVVLMCAFAPSARAAETGVVPQITWGIPKSEQTQEAAAVQDLDAGWVRLNVSWTSFEPKQGSFSFSNVDSAVQLIHSTAPGTKILIMVDETPSWESGSSQRWTPPKNPADYATAVHALAAHLAGQVQAYEVWNEENAQAFWTTGPNAGQYAQLLKAAYPAIKSGDPNVKVLFGGTWGNDYGFLESAYAAVSNLGSYFDVMATHPYPGWGASPEAFWRDSSGRITAGSFSGYREVRATLLNHGDDKPIWFTEMGWATTTQSSGVSLQTQADYLTLAYSCVEQDTYIQVAFWYQLRNAAWRNDQDTWFGQLGLMYTNFTHKPAYDAFKNYRPGMRSCTYTEQGTTSDQSQPAPYSSASGPDASSTSPLVTSAGAGTSASTSVRLQVRRQRSAHASRLRSDSTLSPRPARFAVLGAVANAHGGRVTLYFERRAGGRSGPWQKLARQTVQVTETGSFIRRLSSRRIGRWRVRAVYSGAPGYRASTSPFVTFAL